MQDQPRKGCLSMGKGPTITKSEICQGQNLWRNVGNLDCFAECLGCSVASLPTTYLQLPLGATYKNSVVWHPVISRINKRLAGWKGSFLSKRGRLVLLKSVLVSLPTYFFSLLSIPVLVERRLEKCQRDFLWEKGVDKEGMHLIV